MKGFKDYTFSTNGTHVIINLIDGDKPEANVTSREDYDSTGAMQFVIAVILVYSCISVIGVFVTRFFSERKKKRVHHVDEEANTFLKGIHRNRVTLERQRRKQEVNRILGSSSIKPETGTKSILQAGLLSLTCPMGNMLSAVPTNDDKSSVDAKPLSDPDFSDPVCHSEDEDDSSVDRPARSVSFYLRKDTS